MPENLGQLGDSDAARELAILKRLLRVSAVSHPNNKEDE